MKIYLTFRHYWFSRRWCCEELWEFSFGLWSAYMNERKHQWVCEMKREAQVLWMFLFSQSAGFSHQKKNRKNLQRFTWVRRLRVSRVFQGLSADVARNIPSPCIGFEVEASSAAGRDSQGSLDVLVKGFKGRWTTDTLTQNKHPQNVFRNFVFSLSLKT